MAKKLDINDPAFFDDANLDALGEGIDIPDPDAASDEGVSDDVASDDESVAADAEEDAGDSQDEPVDASDDVDEPGSEGSTDPAPHLDDLDAAKVAYAEVRKWANQRDMEAQKLAERLAELEAENQALTEFDYGDTQPVYDANAFASMAGQDPRAAFSYALASGQVADAQAAVAQVEVDVAELGSLAAIALRDGDQERYQQFRSQAANAAALARQLDGELQQSFVTKQQAPLVEAENRRNVEWAWNALNHETGGDLVARGAQVRQVLAERPYLLQGSGPDAVKRGYADAYQIARALPAPTAPVAAASIDETVAAAVKKHIDETRKAKAAAAEAASGASGSRSGPSGATAGPDLKQDIYDHGAAQSVGAKGFMSL
jgi:hypothetical protein